MYIIGMLGEPPLMVDATHCTVHDREGPAREIAGGLALILILDGGRRSRAGRGPSGGWPGRPGVATRARPGTRQKRRGPLKRGARDPS